MVNSNLSEKQTFLNEGMMIILRGFHRLSNLKVHFLNNCGLTSVHLFDQESVHRRCLGCSA